MMLVAFIIPLCILLSFFIAAWAGNNKKIDFWWAFFFGLTLTPVIALIIILTSGCSIGTGKTKKFLKALASIIAASAAAYLFVTGVDCIETWGCVYLLASVGLAGLYLYFLKQLLFVKPIPPPNHS